jgi:hypothetical protein
MMGVISVSCALQAYISADNAEGDGREAHVQVEEQCAGRRSLLEKCETSVDVHGADWTHLVVSGSRSNEQSTLAVY